MKKFILINGLDVVLFNAESLEQAIIFVQNSCNFSEEVIVREYDSICNNLN